MSVLKRIKRNLMKDVMRRQGYKPRLAYMKKILAGFDRGMKALSR